MYSITDDSLYAYPVLPASEGGIRLGERSLLFRLHYPKRTDSNLGAVSRDGQRILAIATESDEETRVQVLSDWSTLLEGQESRR